jgi:hypothetical protein
LIEELRDIDEQVPGIDSSATFEDFMATESSPRFRMGLLGTPPPNTPAPLRELVRRGVSALPNLLAHLDDSRPTRLLIRAPSEIETVGGLYYATEYDARKVAQTPERSLSNGNQEEIQADYEVKVGDVCFVAIGQIVNRRLLAVRYQPTSLVFVNSPIRSPQLAKETRQDWHGLSEAEHRDSLISDLHDEKRYWLAESAFERLRFFYPTAYANLHGSDAILRTKFEAEEKNRLH